VNPLASLARFAQADRPAQPRVEPCEICGQALEARHRHVLALDRHVIACVCAACAVLFGDERAGARYRTIGTRVLLDPSFRLDPAALARLGIPVRLAFLSYEMRPPAGDEPGGRRWHAVYPSAAGPTMAELGPAGAGALAQIPLARALAASIEALLIYGPEIGAPPNLFVAPIDRCYELVGLLRRRWRGFTGGDEAWTAVDNFFAELGAAAEPLPKESLS
jgi:Family of unknown function (DUF5947)